MELSQLDAILETYRQAGYYPSAVCQVFNEKEILYRRTVGGVDPGGWFDLASVSKLVCTTMLLSLMEEGRFTPETPALSLLPGHAPGPATRRRLEAVTVGQLMTHTSGIVPWYPFYADGRDFYTVLEHVLASTQPETGMAYSDLNFMLLGLVVEAVSGLPLRQALERYVKAPLGISDMAYGPIDPALAVPTCYGNQIEQRMCAQRGLSFDGWRPNGVEVRGACNDGNAFYYWKGASGHAGIFATADALSTLGQFYLSTDRPWFLRAMETCVEKRGLGFDRCDVFPDGCGHSGFTGTVFSDMGKYILPGSAGVDGTANRKPLAQYALPAVETADTLADFIRVSGLCLIHEIRIRQLGTAQTYEITDPFLQK